MTESTRYRVRPAMTFERQTFVYIVETWAGTFDSVHESAESAAERADWMNGRRPCGDDTDPRRIAQDRMIDELS